MIIEFLAENQVGVTISIDGPHGACRTSSAVFHNGQGSYDVVAPKIKALLQRHRSRPIGARVTLTSRHARRQAHLHATSPRSWASMRWASRRSPPRQDRDYAIEDDGL